MNYTKGKWTPYRNNVDDTIAIDLKHTIEHRKPGVVYDEIAVVFSAPANGDVKSNAHLIAAAPDMYEALCAVWNSEIKLPADVLVKVQNAIAKAEGR